MNNKNREAGQGCKSRFFWQLYVMHLNLQMKDGDMPSAQPKSPFSGKNLLKTYLQNSVKKTIKISNAFFLERAILVNGIN